jgi:hypothetical protein
MPSPSRSPSRASGFSFCALLHRAVRERGMRVRLGDVDVALRFEELALIEADRGEMEMRLRDRELARRASHRTVRFGFLDHRGKAIDTTARDGSAHARREDDESDERHRAETQPSGGHFAASARLPAAMRSIAFCA